MKVHARHLAPFLLVLAVPVAMAQKSTPRPKVQLGGTWKAETPDGPRSVIIRPDSSASYGDETVRWRLQGDSIHIAFGDEWMVYHYQLKGSHLILSGGDLEDPITLKRTGPPSPLPLGVAVPPAPPDDRRGTANPVSTGRKTKPAGGTS
jgi:hypothetical protein